ncbi:sperm flagellar protein 1-like isoform X5 [Mizuhopecten yessoensis]|uniref:sperm flagellar protein 1-like isoform X5 n=1 Tax=Mizuhopecten yessoensis TaxID=6573 RepID=UPI000B458540|nr:sperm flagellar protein 1-like isoform X5 [Mizuhopecten yessoensis]
MSTITLRKNINGMNTVGMEEYVDETEIMSVIHWVETIPVSRDRRDLCKDFCDAVMMAEIIKHYFPKLVDLHNYNPASSTKQKLENWYLLNKRVLKRLGMDLSDDVIRALANGKRHVIDRILILLRMQIDNLLARQEALVPVVSKSTGRASPSKSPRKTHRGETNSDRSALEPLALPSERASQVKSPRRIYTKGEIPHNHPDRSHYYPSESLREFGLRTYFSDKRMLPDTLPIYSYMYNHSHVPRLIMEEKELEIMQKEETIQMLNAKIQSMERLLNLKQVRIEDLHAKLVACRGVYYVTDGGTKKIIR